MTVERRTVIKAMFLSSNLWINVVFIAQLHPYYIYICIILIIFSLFIGSVEIDAAALGIGSVIFTLTASDNEGDNLYYGITCNPSGCPFVLLDCKYFHIYVLDIKTSLKIPNEQSEAVHRRMTDNTMVKRKKANTDSQKTKNWAIRIPLKTGGELMCSGRVNRWHVSFNNCSTMHILYLCYSIFQLS